MMKQITTTVCATVLMASCCNINNTEQQVNQQVDELYSRMSQPERIAQLRSGYMDELFDAEGNLDTVKCKQLIPYGIGHFSQYASQELVDANFLRKRVAVVQDWLMHHTPNGIPALFHEEVLSGINTQDATADRSGLFVQSRVGRAQDFADRYCSSQDGWRIVAFPYGRRLPYSKF